ncbi:hypothetical protein BSLG_007309 [Batrachochytrium salamandrivorans]|nr:hypothetical protein BSLG_007309 [Batrachochytrium salamandrivorans]
MLERFQAFPKNINRADTARYMYMYLHGGFYADLDMECLKPHTVIAQRGGLVAPLMSRDYSFEHNIPNAWMGSAPRHPFWIFLLNKIKDRPLDNEIESATGPVVMYHALREFEKDYLDETMPPITYMSPETILPYDWHNTANLIEICSAQRDTLDPEKCKKAVDPDLKAFAITYWSHTWGDGDAMCSIKSSSYRSVFLVLLFVVGVTLFMLPPNMLRAPISWVVNCRAPTVYTPGTAATKPTPIPRIIHHSWKTQDLPKKFVIWRDSWRDQHPFWEHKLWTDSDNLKLCTEDFPWFLDTYNSMAKNINRADAARYMYMYKFGGFYSDLDVECIKNHMPLARWGGLILPLMSDDYLFDNNIPNAWMGSIPGHPFWLFLLKRISSNELPGRVEAVAGPMALREGAVAYSAFHGVVNTFPIHYVEPGIVFPYDWHRPEGVWKICSAQSPKANFTMCKQILDPKHRAYSITYWSHTWGDGTTNVDKDEVADDSLLYRRKVTSLTSVYREMRE